MSVPLSCPFCGNKAEVVTNNTSYPGARQVRCVQCSATASPCCGTGDLDERAVKTWNLRQPAESQRALLDEAYWAMIRAGFHEDELLRRVKAAGEKA